MKTSIVFRFTSKEVHLGNGRVWFSDLNEDGKIEKNQDNNEVTQEKHYYPFGMTMNTKSNTNDVSPTNRFQYNSKELESELGMYNYGFRFYDPAIARWTSVDPLAEVIPEVTPYASVFNNPIKYYDPDGRMGKIFNFKRFRKKISKLVSSIFKRNTSYSCSLDKTLINKNKKPRKKWRGIARYIEGQQDCRQSFDLFFLRFHKKSLNS